MPPPHCVVAAAPVRLSVLAMLRGSIALANIMRRVQTMQGNVRALALAASVIQRHVRVGC
jgi:hypothetical protein